MKRNAEERVRVFILCFWQYRLISEKKDSPCLAKKGTVALCHFFCQIDSLVLAGHIFILAILAVGCSNEAAVFILVIIVLIHLARKGGYFGLGKGP